MSPTVLDLFTPLARWRARALPLLALAFAAGCGGGDGPSAPRPRLTTIDVVVAPGTIRVRQSATAQAAGRDQNGASIATGPVTWSSSAAAVATVSASGVVSAVAPGQATITATAGGVQGQATVTVEPGPPATVSQVGTLTQAAVAGTTLGERVAVLVRDADGFPVPNVPVTFTLVSSGGALRDATPRTGPDGIAALGGWTLAPTVGVNRVEATVTGLPPVTFAVATVAGPPAIVTAASALPASATVGSSPAVLPAVEVLDANRNPVSGATVTFAVTAGGGTLRGATAATTAAGIATVADWTLGTAVGVNTVVAVVGTLPSVSFTVRGTPDAPAQLVVVRGADQVATVNTAVPVPPAVRVRDRFGNGVPGIAVGFAVASGGGRVVGASVPSDTSGLAAVEQWTLGTRAGANVLRATSGALPAVSIAATGTPDQPATYGFVAGAGQIEVVGQPVGTTPAVRVEDRYGNGVGSVPVAFSVTRGGGSVAVTDAVTGANGVATPGAWRLGPTEGFHVLEAASPGFPALQLRARGVPPSNHPIELRYVGAPPPVEIQSVLQAAVERVRKVFVAAPTPLFTTADANECIAGQPAMAETIRGTVIWVDIRRIDGRGGVLGSASWCVRRVPSLLTLVGSFRLDIDDLADGLDDGTAYSTIVHEMLHIFGVGAFWSRLGLLSGTFTSDPWFNGPAARAAFRAMGGGTHGGNVVPVENVGGSGTALSHWRTSLMAPEMMTGYSCGGPAPLSLITLASFLDMGIPVTVYGDDDFTVRLAGCPPGRRRDLHETPLPSPERLVDEASGAILTNEEAAARLRARPALRIDALLGRPTPPADRLRAVRDPR